ncbi:MAG: AsmA family protein [Rhodospirillales bacterium]|nr:AsmA family protein [Rhodospirillales bacterium]
MRTGIKIISVAFVLIIGLIVAGVAILKSIDFNDYKELIAEKAKEATGRDLAIAGDLNLEISLTPKIAVEGVSFSNAAWGSRKEMVTIRKFSAEVSLLPLLSGTIDVNRVILEGVDLLAETDANGAENWALAAAPGKPEKEKSGGMGVIPVVRLVSIRDVKITYKDGVSGVTQNLGIENIDIKADGPDAPLGIDLNADVNGQVIKVAGNIGSVNDLLAGRLMNMKLDVSALAARVTIEGKAGVDGGKPVADLIFSLSGDKLADTLSAASTFAPQLKETPVPPITAYSVGASVSFKNQLLRMDGLAIKLDETALTGNLALNLAGKVPGLEATLASDLIDVDKLLPKSDKSATPAPAANAGDGRIFPNDPLPLDGLKAVNAKIRLDIKKILAQGIEVTNTTVALSLLDGKLNITPLTANVFGGSITGNIALDGASQTPGLVAVLGVKQLDYGAALKSQGMDDMAVGKVDVDIDVSGKGTSVRELMAGLNGKTRIQARDGQIKSGALNIISTDLLNVLDSKDDKKLICAVIDFDIKNGLADTRAIVIETGGFSVLGTGMVNLKDETPKLRIDPRAKKASVASAAMVPFDVSGTLAKPVFAIDPAAMAGNVAAGAARTGAAVATMGLSLLAEKAIGAATSMVFDETDYCTPALAGEKIVPGKAQAVAPAKGDGGSADPAANKSENPVEGIAKGIGSGLKNLFGN